MDEERKMFSLRNTIHCFSSIELQQFPVSNVNHTRRDSHRLRKRTTAIPASVPTTMSVMPTPRATHVIISAVNIFTCGTHSQRRDTCDATSDATVASLHWVGVGLLLCRSNHSQSSQKIGQTAASTQTQWGDATAPRGSTTQQRVALQCVCTLIVAACLRTTSTHLPLCDAPWRWMCR